MSKDFMIISQAAGSLILIGIIVWQWYNAARTRWALKILTESSNILLRDRSAALKACDEAHKHTAQLNKQLAIATSHRVYKWNRTKDPKQPYSMLVIASSEITARALARGLFVSRRLHVRYPNVAPVSQDVAMRESHELFTEVPDSVALQDMAAAAFILNLPEG